MKHETDFSALQNLLALKKLEMPLDTEVDRFLIEFHRRQRAGLLVPESRLDRVVSWLRGLVENLQPVPSLAGVGAFAAIAIACIIGLAPQSPADSSSGAYNLSFSLPTRDAAFAMIPASYTRTTTLGSSAKSDSLSFTPAARPAATRFILSNPRVAYDATAAF
jgi:hypothetical protein